MATDLTLAILHHIMVFGLVTLVVSEGVLLRCEMSASIVTRLARLDRSYGATALIIIVVGISRVIFGAKGYEYYIGNPWFWAKMASFAAAGLLSIAPTIRFLAWRRALARDPSYLPPAGEVAAALRFIRIESVFIILILAFAATMARFG